jgi:hypothetical protein
MWSILLFGNSLAWKDKCGPNNTIATMTRNIETNIVVGPEFFVIA